LASCYRRSLEVALSHGVRTIAFPAISCGIYGYPIEPDAEIAVREAGAMAGQLAQVIFACFGDDIFAAYSRLLAPP